MYSNQIKNAKIDKNSVKIDCKVYYPQNLVYELMIPKEFLKKN
jgi:hypothetical protein